MDWKSFLKLLCERKEYELTSLEVEVLICLEEDSSQTKKDLLEAYISSYSEIEEEAFTQRLKNIYRKFQITGGGYKLPKLRKHLAEKYNQYKNKDIFFSEIGLTYIHSRFPRDSFRKAIESVISSDNERHKKIDILQTFAPNLEDYSTQFIRSLNNDIQIRVLLAWPYSEAANLREIVLKRYANGSISDEVNIRDSVISNLETLEKISKSVENPNLLTIKLYDTLPSLAIYRAGDYMLAAPFLHNSLAIETFQFELQLTASNQFISYTLKKDFELMWKVARLFHPDPDRNWRNDLKILFAR